MRIYLPATASDIAAESITPRWAHAVTPQLRRALPEEDDEGLEASAMLAAADDSVLRLRDEGATGAPSTATAEGAADGVGDGATAGGRGDGATAGGARPVARRVVIAAEISAATVRVPAAGRPWQPGDDRLPSAVETIEAVEWRDVVAIHVDEAQGHELVRAAMADDDAIEAAAELDLLWYDVVERDTLRAELAQQRPPVAG